MSTAPLDLLPPLPRTLLGCVVAALCLAGCEGRAPQLDSAGFQDNLNSDGRLGEGERILLTFDAPVRLGGTGDSESAKGAGVRFTPADSGRMNAYALVDSRMDSSLDPRQIGIVILGFAEASVAGRYGHDEGSTGVIVDHALAGIVDGRGKPLTGISSVVDLSPRPKRPPRLLRSVWIDRDRSRSISEGDEIELVFDEPVEPSDRVRATGSVVPREFLMLPVEGDRLDDGLRESRLRRGGPNSHHVKIVLGSNPRLTPQGTFGAAKDYRGAPSGIAINGTTIRPNPAIVDASGVGVAGPTAVDLEGECTTLFRGETDRSNLKSLERFTMTALSDDGALVVIGGWDASRGAATRQGLIRRADGSTREFELPAPRYGHVALPFAGRDGVRGTEDDFVIVGGGLTDTTTPARTTLVVFPFASGPMVRALEIEGTDPLSRIGSTAHAIEPSVIRAIEGAREDEASRIGGAIVVVGGFDQEGRFATSIETITLSENGREARVSKDDSLRWPRAYASSIVAGPQKNPWLFLYGGYTRGLLSERTLFRTLSHPELFEIKLRADDENGIDLVPIALPDAERFPAPPGARYGHRLVDLGTQEESVLLVGGTAQIGDEDSNRPRDERLTRLVHRVQIDPSALEPVRYRAIGESVVERRDPTCIRFSTGQVLVVGGEDGEQRALRTAEFIDPVRDAVEIACQSLVHPRRRFAAVPTGDGGWVLLGGAGPTDDWAAELVEAP